ncbi:hypothetical protein SUGI_0083010 [Cryptomeria japonica]|nr:hypothetical protein SUGI_0083010 [Cryptomeria japonica]
MDRGTIEAGRSHKSSSSKLLCTMELVSAQNQMLNLLVLRWIYIGCISLGVMDVDGAPYVPAMFILGDSLADIGNNNFIPECSMRANITPYGISAYPQPTSRFSNGFITFDHIGMNSKMFLRHVLE